MTATTMTQTSATSSRPQRNMADMLTTAALPVAVLLLALFFYIEAPVFLTPRNLISITVQVAALMTIAIPFSILLMAGKVDLGVGSLLGLCGVVAGLSFPVMGVVGTVLFTLGVGLVVGLVNGLLVSWLSMSPIIVTLGGLTLMRGLAQYLSPAPLFGFPESFSYLGYGTLLGLPILTWIMLAVLVAGIAFMRFSPVGRHTIAIGVNERAAHLVGIRVRLTVMLLYAAVGGADDGGAHQFRAVGHARRRHGAQRADRRAAGRRAVHRRQGLAAARRARRAAAWHAVERPDPDECAHGS